MRVVVQRVKKASVSVDGNILSEIGTGLLLLVAFTHDDDEEAIQWMAGKISNLRIFNDEAGVMNRSVMETDGELLAVSQFTLYARTRKGNRPSYVDSAGGDVAEPLFNRFAEILAEKAQRPVGVGQFGADMAVELINDGPVTIIIDSAQ